MTQKFSAGQQILLKQRFAAADADTIPGTWLIDGSLTYVKAVAGEFATFAQGTNADTALSWGNHAAAGYLTLATVPVMRVEEFVAGGALPSVTLAVTPATGSKVAVFVALAASPTVFALLRESTDFAVAGAVVTFTAPYAIGDIVQVIHYG